MGRFDNTGLQKWTDRSNSPAAPAGAQQGARAAGGYESGGGRFENSGLGRWVSQEGQVDAAQTWYTGRNAEGTNNGWDTDFWNRTMAQNKEFGEKGILGQQFEQANATGVVTWDHTSSDGRHKFEFGDIYDNGKKVGNVFEQFDQSTADLMMADVLFSKDEKAHIYSDSDITGSLRRAVSEKRESNNTDIPKAMQAADFQKDVTKRADSFDDSGVDEAIVGGGAAGGAVLAGGVVASTGVGLIPGALIAGTGALVGGVGAYLNKDELTEQAARAYEITSMSSRENGTGAGIATGVTQWAGFGGKLISPLSNLSHGITDYTLGEVGDEQSEFYRVDDKGERTIPTWLKVADVGASVADSAIQFASPAGVMAYTGQMSAVIGGEVAELSMTGGKSFDYSRGGFDSIFTDDDGNFDGSAAAAGIGKIGIDAVQLGMVRGLASKADAARVGAGEKSLYGRVLGMPARLSREKLPTRLGGWDDAQKAALRNGGRETEAAGFKFVLDDTGKVVGDQRKTLSLLAPSEQLSGLSARIIAKRQLAKEGGAYTADDFYRAANAMATGERKFTTALVNGMGEGYEEAVQAVLEPHSHGESVSFEEIGSAAVMGFAGGLGMGLGMAARMPSADQKLFAQAQVAQLLRTGGVELTASQWKSMSETQKRSLAAMSGLEQSTAKAAFDKVVDEQGAQVNAGVVGANKLADAIENQRAAALAKATDRTDGAFVISQHEDPSMPSDAVGASALQTLANLNQHVRGAGLQVRSIKAEVARIDQQLAGDPQNPDLLEQKADLMAKAAQAEQTEIWGQQVLNELDVHVQRMYADTATEASIEAEAEVVNQILRDMFHEKFDFPDGNPLTPDERRAIARAVSLRYTRDPQDQSGSYPMLVPQISAALTAAKADNVLQISHAILPAISGDFDGDKIRQLNQLILDDAEWTTLRSGSNLLGAGTSVNVGAMKYEKWIVGYLAESLSSPNTSLANYATGTLTVIGDQIRARYENVIDAKTLDLVLERFFTAVRAGDKDARSTLLDGLATEAGTQITEFSRKRVSNEWLWIDNLVRSELDRFQRAYAAHGPQIGDAPNTDRVLVNRQTQDVQERRIEHAATVGATVGNLLAGDQAFRQAQKLHYSSLVAAVLTTEYAGTRSDIQQLAELYEALGSQITQSELDEIRSKDEITGRVYLRLQRIANEAKQLNPDLQGVEALAAIANLKIADIDIEADGTAVPNGREITLTQFLLKQSINEDKRAKQAILDISPELAAKHARLMSMTFPPTQGVKGSKPVNAQRAFVEVVGSQQMITLLGNEADVFGPHLTVDQFVRYYTSLSETDRRAMDRKLQGEAPYLGRKSKHDMPYELAEVRAGEVSAYRAVVDAVLAVGHHRITIDEKGNLHGELADRSAQTSKDFRSAIDNARQAVLTYMGATGRRDGELDPQVMQRMVESNPDFARQVMGLIPDSVAHAVFEVRDGKVYIANWVFGYDERTPDGKTRRVEGLFTAKDSKHAEMIYWRNLLLARWNASGAAAARDEESDEGSKGREYNRLKTRMERVLFRLAAQDDNGYLMQKFLEQMESATDPDEFMRWVNTTPGIRGEQAPLTLWVDDVAEFDMDKSSGGWTTVLQGAELREAVSSLKRGAESLVKDLAEEQAAMNADAGTRAAIRRVIRKDAGANVTLDAGDRELYDRFVKTIEQASDLAMGLGPQAMIYQTIGAAMGFYPQAHTKGKNPPNVELAGLFDAMRDAFDYTTNYERVMASLTAVNLDAVGNNLAQVLKDGGRAMDDHGRPVSWAKPSPEQMLDLLENVDTRPMARAMLYPQVMERDFDGALRPKLLVDKSLKSLINGASHRDLFPKAGKLTHDAAFRYLAMVEAQARAEGGHFSVQRVANDLVIARTSAADHALSIDEIEQLTLDAYYEIAQILQASGSLAAQPVGTVDPLVALFDKAKDAAREVAVKRRVALAKGETRDMAELALDSLIQERKDELTAARDRILDRMNGVTDDAEILRLQQQITNLTEEQRLFEERIDLLREDDLVRRVVTMYGFNPTHSDEDKVAIKQALVSYVSDHLTILETGSASLITLNKLTNMLQDSGTAGHLPNLTDKEWTEISNAVVAVFIDNTVSLGAGSVAPFPGITEDGELKDEARYYDPTFSYLLEPLMQRGHKYGLVEAAAKVHNLAGRAGEEILDSDFIDLLDRTIFADFSLGNWTADIPRASIEANQRLDSAAAAAAIAMAGNSPKRQAAIAAATRRTFKVPGPELMSRVSLNWVTLNQDVFDEVDVQLPSGPVKRPLAQLSNRFARSVQMTYTDSDGTPQTVDLLAAWPNLGRPWVKDDAAAGSGLQEIHVERIQQAVDQLKDQLAFDPITVSIDVEFVHPDSQPSGPDWMNNLFFEGTSFKLDGDTYDSLASSLYFSANAINQSTQRAALDASKLGKPALQVVPTPTAADREGIEQAWTEDFAGMLRAKTRIMLSSDLGFGKLDPEFYNAAYKDMKLRHFVRGTVDGQVTLWTAEQVIEFQQANPGTPLPLDEASLWVPSDDVLREMLGEQGTQGISTVFPRPVDYDLNLVPRYRGVTEFMLRQFGPGISGNSSRLQDTRLVNRARQQVLTVRTRIDEKEKTAYEVRMKYLAEQKLDIYGDRAADLGRFNPRTNMAKALKRADTMLRAENIAFDWSNGGAWFVGPRRTADSSLSRMLLHDLEAMLEADDYRTGWVYREGSDAIPAEGTLNEVALSTLKRSMRVAKGDFVAIETDSFTGKDRFETMEKRLSWFASKGATIVISSGDGSTDGRAEAAELLESMNYVRVAGSGHVYQPADMTTRYQNQKARASTLTEVRGVSQRNHIAILNTFDKMVEENAAYVLSNDEKLGAIAVTMNLVPTDAFAGYNVPTDSTDGNSQMVAVRQHLLGMDNAAGRTLLREQANGSLKDEARRKADIELDGALDRLFDRLRNNPGTVLPKAGDPFGTGDIIPLVGPGGKIILYRHGMKAPKNRDVIDKMQLDRTPGSMDALNVAIYPTKPEAAATTHTGEVVQFRPRSAHGLQVELQIPLQVFGDKKVLEWNGMKYVLTPSPESIGLPEHTFMDGWHINLLASAHDMASKESLDGVVNNHRNAFAYFGIDFTDDVAKFFKTDARTAKEILNAIATELPRTSVAAADELLNAPRLAAAFTDLLPGVAQRLAGATDPSWVDRVSDPSSVEAQIVRAMIVYLTIPGARVEHVLKSGGFNDQSSGVDAQSILMPRLFTQVFDNAAFGSDLRVEINKRLNQQITNPNNDGTGYTLAQDFTFATRHPDPTKNLRGFLQFAEAHSSGDNPVKNGMSFDEAEAQAVSQHSAAIAYQSIGADSAASRGIDQARLFAAGVGVTRFDKDAQDGGVWRMLTGINKESTKPWRASTPAESLRRNMAREAVVQFRQPIPTLDEYGWSTPQRKTYDDLAVKIVQKLGLTAEQKTLVDFWVRQGLGRPDGHDRDGNDVGKISAKAAIETANDIWWSVERGYLPTVAAMVPLTHVHDLQLIFRANRGKAGGWAPRESVESNSGKADTWDEWVKASLGTAFTTENLFDPLYLLALDGFMHTYQSATRELLDLPVSMDALVAQDMLNEETNRMLVSLDVNQDLLASDPILLDIERVSLDELIGGQRIAGRLEAKAAPATEIAKRRDQIRKWRRENDIPLPLDVTMKNFRKNGAEFVHHSTTTNALARMLINLRVGTALLNPALYVSMGPEQWIRGGLDRAANLITGQGTVGLTAKATAAAGVSRYTPEQLVKLGKLYRQLGQRNDFKAMVFRDLMYLRPHEPGIGKMEKWLEGYAKLGSRMQDPTWGMRQTTMARRYLEAALQHINATPTLHTLTTDRLIAELSVNPQYLKDNFPAAHEAATNAIAQLRSLKATPLSLALRGIYEPMSESSNSFTNFFGNVVLKMPLLFSGYSMNVLTTITGMQGISDMTAAMLHGRAKGPNSLLGRAQAKLRGEEFTPERDAEFDMSSVMEGIDLTRSFIRGGITHTGLFMFGLAAGGLGLSGEDDETKKRRRLAKLQGAGFIYDPRAIENDFRNADSIFLDWLPFGLDQYFKVTPGEDGRSMGQLHWMMKQFISPIMGFEKFYETGDFRNVTWGFQDAIGSFPLINTWMWDDAVQTSAELASMADDEQKVGGPTNIIAAGGLLTNAVGVYERMLFENAFVNQLYTSFDRYDRDPYALALIDSDGDVQVDSEGNPRPNDLAMEPYVDPETGEIKTGYQGRSALSGTLHALTENRATMAFAMAMFTGLDDSDYLRKNMVVKTREMEKTPLTQEQAEEFVKAVISGAAVRGEVGVQTLNAEELAQIWKNDAKERGEFVDWGKVDAAAEAYVAAVQQGQKVDMSMSPVNPTMPTALSIINADGMEELTPLGARAIFQGLAKGTAKPGDPGLQGIAITKEMREAIQKEWMAELKQEGLDMGLDITKANSRMKRLWYGPTTDPSIKGLGDILWDKNISYAPKATYKQLNTTYVMGPDGRPWATGFTRDGLMGALGLKPVKRAYVSEQGATGNDERLNTTDLVNGMNTGLRALELVDESAYIPTDVEIGKSIEAAIKEAMANDDGFAPYAKTSSGGGSGWRNFGGYGRRGGGGYGGGYSGGGYSQFQRMYQLPGSTTPYANDISFINTSNPLIRRGDVRRERVWSERGRLKQWQ